MRVHRKLQANTVRQVKSAFTNLTSGRPLASIKTKESLKLTTICQNHPHSLSQGHQSNNSPTHQALALTRFMHSSSSYRATKMRFSVIQMTLLMKLSQTKMSSCRSKSMRLWKQLSMKNDSVLRPLRIYKRASLTRMSQRRQWKS